MLVLRSLLSDFSLICCARVFFKIKGDNPTLYIKPNMAEQSIQPKHPARFRSTQIVQPHKSSIEYKLKSTQAQRSKALPSKVLRGEADDREVAEVLILAIMKSMSSTSSDLASVLQC